MLTLVGGDQFSCRRDTLYIIGSISCRRRSVVGFYCTVDQLSVDQLTVDQLSVDGLSPHRDNTLAYPVRQ
jgi:hypothetical protein